MIKNRKEMFRKGNYYYYLEKEDFWKFWSSFLIISGMSITTWIYSDIIPGSAVFILFFSLEIFIMYFFFLKKDRIVPQRKIL